MKGIWIIRFVEGRVADEYINMVFAGFDHRPRSTISYILLETKSIIAKYYVKMNLLFTATR